LSQTFLIALSLNLSISLKSSPTILDKPSAFSSRSLPDSCAMTSSSPFAMPAAARMSTGMAIWPLPETRTVRMSIE